MMGDSLFPDAVPMPEVTPAKEVAKEPELSFEEALGSLEALVHKMEAGQLPLEKLISSYEEGGKLAKICRARLDQLERKIQILSGNAENAPQWEDFQASGTR